MPHDEEPEVVDLGSWIVDVATASVTCSADLLTLVGIRRPPGGILRMGDLFAHAAEDDRLRVSRALQDAVLLTGVLSEDVCLHLGDVTRWVRVRGKVSTANPSRVVGTCQDITADKQRERAEAEGGRLDPVTGLIDHARFLARLRQAIRSIDGDVIGILHIDLDRFADINERFGSDAGDAVLARVAARLTRSIRPGDVVARLGGDEFAVLCVELVDDESLPRMARRMLNAIAVPMPLAGEHVRVTASIGMAEVDAADTDPETALREADAAMYEAKQGGRARVESFDRAARSRRATQRRVSDEIAAALADEQFELWFQPMVALDDWRPVGVEALVRWRHPERGVLSAGEFIGVAEDDDSILDLGEWVLRAACKHAAATSLAIAVNVSAKQLAASDFVTVVLSALVEADLEADRLCIEITESVLVEDVERSIEVLQQVRAIGVRVAIDDFGIGYSSLSYMKRLPVDVVKIDRSFIADLGDPASDAIVAAITTVSRALGFTVVAEGVEARKQLIALRALRCDVVQGFLLAWPMTAAELQEWDPRAWQRDAPSTDVDLREVLGRRAESHRRRTGRSIVVQASSTPVTADPETIGTVVDELLNNALAYSAPDLPVVIRATSHRRWVRVSIADYGIGMTDHDASRCWEQFFQGTRSPVSAARGTGIGLYVVRSLIEGMGGFVSVKTSAKGHSTFTFAIPRRPRPTGEGVGERSSIQEFMKQAGIPPRGER
jgi:diguanylate cyclase (GGDEF)-like protein